MTSTETVSMQRATTTQVHRVYIMATPERIWQAITDPEWNGLYGYSAPAEYELTAGKSQKLELFARPVYKWARAGADGGNNGAIYVWTRQGCAEAVACFWRSTNGEGKLSVAHELHSLSPDVLTSERAGPKRWQPKAGVPRQIVPDAPVPAATATARLQQMRFDSGSAVRSASRGR